MMIDRGDPWTFVQGTLWHRTSPEIRPNFESPSSSILTWGQASNFGEVYDAWDMNYLPITLTDRKRVRNLKVRLAFWRINMDGARSLLIIHNVLCSIFSHKKNKWALVPYVPDVTPFEPFNPRRYCDKIRTDWHHVQLLCRDILIKKGNNDTE